jgi:hypothetical protein
MRTEYIENLEGEIWIENNGYEISNKGRIITKWGKLSQGGITSFGYKSCIFSFSVHHSKFST